MKPEELVLGAVLVDRDCISQVIDIITTEEMFGSDMHRAIWKAIRNLYDKGLDVDYYTVSTQITKNGDSGLVPTVELLKLTNNVASSAHIETHALLLKQDYIRRATELECLRTLKDCGDVTKDSLEIVSDLQSNIEKISISSDLKYEKSIQDIVIEIATAKESDFGIPSHPLLNSPKHFRGGDLIILAARPSMGKTAFALSVAEFVANEGYPVGILSLEMTSRSLVSRMIATKTGIAYDRILSNTILEGESETYLKGTGYISELPIYIDDQGGISEHQAKAKATRMKSRHGIQLLIVDYLQLMHSNDRKAGSREQEISRVSSTLKNIAKQLDIPVLALSQLSRRCEERSDKKPILSDLRDSGSIEQDADMVMLMYRPEYYGLTETPTHNNTEGLCQIITAKQRNGALLTNDMRYVGEKFKFEQWTPAEGLRKIEF